MNFDDIGDRRGRGSVKWDAIESFAGISPDDGLPMWVASMDFPPAEVLQDAARALIERGEYGYFTGTEGFYAAAADWQKTRHGWAADPAHFFATHGIGNAIALCLNAFTEEGDRVIVFTPVYHEFHHKVARNRREVLQSPLKTNADGLFEMDLDALEGQLTGRERIVLISAPHNPAGRIWSREELSALADFCIKHDLLLVSDEIHQDLVMPGHRHVPAAVAAPQALDRLIVMGAASKTFDIAGLRTGWVAIPGDDLRARFARLVQALDIQPNLFGMEMSRAAYSPGGAEWVDALMAYLDGNRRLFCEGIAGIPGLAAMPMQATYLAWVDFAGTGMSAEEIDRRVKGEAKIAPSPGPAFGIGGEGFHRFNIGTSRALVEEAVDRLRRAFGDLQ